MANENCSEKIKGGNGMNHKSFLGGAYFLTVVGAVVYFLQHATTFWGGVLGFLKGLVWPALVVYKILELLKL